MTKTDINGLLAFLKDNAKSDEAKALIAELVEPLLRRLETIAESGRWPLAAEADGERLERLAADFGELTGTPGLRCMAVSALRPFPKPERMNENVYRASLGEVLDDDLMASLWAGLRDIIWPGLGDNLRGILVPSLRAGLQGILVPSLYFCLGYALAGDRKMTECRARIVGAFADGVIPLGLKHDEPDVIIVLKA